MKKIVFLITNLEIGGAEKVLIDLVNLLKNDYSITVLTLYGKGSLIKDLPNEVIYKSINSSSYREMNYFKRKLTSLLIKCPLTRKYLYKKYLKNKYDVEIAFLEGPMTTLANTKCKNNVKKIAWIHTDMSSHYSKEKYSSIVKDYMNYEKIIFVSHDAKDKFQLVDVNKKLIDKEEVIHNYIDIERVMKRSMNKLALPFEDENINFLVVSRLVQAKGIDRLIKVHKKLIDKKLYHNIYVIGDGILYNELNKLKNDLGVSDTFHLLGQKENPYPYIKNCTYLLMPSYYEGFGMVLVEGMILGKNIIITDTAAKEVVRNYSNHIVCKNDFDDLFKTLQKVINKKIKFNNKENKLYEQKEIIDKMKKVIEE